ncbi:MAG: 2-hydroxyacid dehydrogenase [Brevundimonas sp.]|jgi:glyoxylate reductase|uniref:2-hydroxyacid dehydrogenase n=1 Tax=Brevundimonas sp. TaxID=1871086 RepID=UPI00391D5B3B
MSSRKLKVVLTRRLPDAIETRLRELFDTELNLDDAPMSREALVRAMQQADVLVPTITDDLSAGVIAQAGEGLRLIANFGAGVDHIDLAAASARNIIVTNTPGVLTEDTADMAMALLLAVSRRLLEGAEVMAEGRFEGWTPTWMCGRGLWGKRLGIIGMGRIGQALARRARAFGMQVHYHNRKPVSPLIEDELSATYWDDIDQMLPRMDVVSLNCPHTPATHHLMSRERLERMAPHAYLINTARGEIIDEAALAEVMQAGALGGVGLDVFEHEPRVHPGLIGQRNVVLMPHLGSATVETRHAMGERVILNIQTLHNGHRPPDRVVAAML